MTATLTGLFAATVNRHPHRIAVSDDGQEVTYAELDARSDAFARELLRRGVAAEDLVGVYLRRGADVVIAILGILKAGAAYVAVDSRYPDARRDLMLTHSGAKLVVTEPDWIDRIAHLPCSQAAVADGAGTSAAPPDVAVTPASAACVLFTSGSSGMPKAAVLEHANIVGFAKNPSLPALTPDDRVGQLSSLSFDAFHFELWCSLAYGAELVVLPTLPELLAADLQRELRRRRISVLLVPTMAVNHVVREDRDAFAPLRILHTGGDVILPATCRDLLSGAFAGRLFNLYGPTEATTACTAYEVTEVPVDAGSVPIGQAMHGARVYVLDGALAPVPDGEPGELHVGGYGVARGYLGQPDLTEQRFRPDPFAADGTRMYATGDLVRRRDDGVLEFLGRADSQVKIRGYRVELGEVERTLCRHPDLHDVAVLADGADQDRRLVAIAVADRPIQPRALREFAAEQLPDYMVPSLFLMVPEIPANEHGKRDHAQLREALDAERRRRDAYVDPRTDTEKYLAELWAELLAVESVSAMDDFFSLGGHSLLAFRMQKRIQRDRGAELDFRDVLKHSTVSGLAALIDTAAAREMAHASAAREATSTCDALEAL